MSDSNYLLVPNPDGTWSLDVPNHRCARGWVGEDRESRPIPCLVCKPHLRHGLTEHARAEAGAAIDDSPTPEPEPAATTNGATP